MKISVFGTGYVGLVTGVCFAEKGHSVICVDINAEKIERLRHGVCPIYEPGLEQLIQKNIRLENLHFSTDIQRAIHASEVLVIAVGTPTSAKGAVDLSQIFQVVEDIVQFAEQDKTIVIKSTVPVGTFHVVKEKLGNSKKFRLVSNPEFLREGSAVDDCLNPARIILGVEESESELVLKNLYSDFVKNSNQILVMDPASSELTKYAANAMLAARVSLMNEFARLSEKAGANIQMIERGVGADPRIGSQYLQAGLGYGGSCLPKDLRALLQMACHQDEQLPLLLAIEETNSLQKDFFFQKIKKQFSSLKGIRVAIWGTAFKAGTDDVRESPALALIQKFLVHEAEVHIFDPQAMANTKKYFSNQSIQFHSSMYDPLESASALVIATEWNEFKNADLRKIKGLMKLPLVFDGRQNFKAEKMRNLDFSYFPVGHAAVHGSATRPSFEGLVAKKSWAAMASEALTPD